MRMRVNQTSNGHASRYEADMAEHLEKRVLHDLVRVGRIVQVLIGDAHRAALVNRDELGEALPRRIHRAVGGEVANVDRNPRVLR